MNTDTNVAETTHRLSIRLAATAHFCDSLNFGQLCPNPNYKSDNISARQILRFLSLIV